MNSKNVLLALVCCVASGNIFAAANSGNVVMGLDYKKLGDSFFQAGNIPAAITEYNHALDKLYGTPHEMAVRYAFIEAIKLDPRMKESDRAKWLRQQADAIERRKKAIFGEDVVPGLQEDVPLLEDDEAPALQEDVQLSEQSFSPVARSMHTGRIMKSSPKVLARSRRQADLARARSGREDLRLCSICQRSFTSRGFSQHICRRQY